MAKALIIKGANFTENAVAHITYDVIHATAITLSDETLSFTAIGATKTLTYAITPADAEDAILWQSSNPNVATVSSGVVTVTGCGTCSITVTAGSVSASCAVTVTVELAGYGHYSKAIVSAGTNTNRMTRMEDLTGTSNTSYNVYLAACVGQAEYEDLILSYDFAKIGTSGNYEIITTRQGLVDAGLGGSVRIFDHIGFPAPILLAANCTRIRTIAPSAHYGAYVLFFKHDVPAYDASSDTTGKAHFSPYRELATAITSYTFTYAETEEFAVPSGYDSVAVCWKADGESGTVNPADMTSDQMAAFRIVCL